MGFAQQWRMNKMRIDFTRLIVVILGFFVAQILIQSVLLSIGITGLPFVILYNLLLSFVATLIYYPAGYRKQAFKEPEFYRNVVMFFVVFVIISLI